MKNINYLLICFGIFLASCGSPSSPSSPKVPFKPVGNDTAKLMIKKYLTPESTADTTFKEVPKMVGLDTKTIKSFITGNDVLGIKFILAAYLSDTVTAPLAKNTILLQIKMKKGAGNIFNYYDLRVQWDPNSNTLVKSSGVLWDENDFICPPPDDCNQTIEDKL
jgi:hypothetical protein